METNINAMKELGGEDMGTAKTTPMDINEVIKNAGNRGMSKYVNAAEVEKGLKKVEVLSVLEAYQKEFTDKVTGEKRMRTFIDILVKSLSEYRNGEEMTFSMGMMQVDSMKTFFTADPVKWVGMKLRLLSQVTMKGKTVIIDRD